MRQAYDVSIEQGQFLTQGATVLVAIDLFETNEQSFTVSSGVITLFDGDGVEDLNIDGAAITVTTGLRGSVRLQYTVQGAWTDAIDPGDEYYFIWDFILGDGQTRKARQSVEVRAA